MTLALHRPLPFLTHQTFCPALKLAGLLDFVCWGTTLGEVSLNTTFGIARSGEVWSAGRMAALFKLMTVCREARRDDLNMLLFGSRAVHAVDGDGAKLCHAPCANLSRLEAISAHEPGPAGPAEGTAERRDDDNVAMVQHAASASRSLDDASGWQRFVFGLVSERCDAVHNSMVISVRGDGGIGKDCAFSFF